MIVIGIFCFVSGLGAGVILTLFLSSFFGSNYKETD